MNLLKNHEEFENWKIETGFAAWENIPEPTEYPCYAYTIVSSWGNEEEKPIYLYANHVHKMISDLRNLRPAPADIQTIQDRLAVLRSDLDSLLKQERDLLRTQAEKAGCTCIFMIMNRQVDRISNRYCKVHGDNSKPAPGPGPIQKVKCSACGKITAGRVPKGGDGSLLLPRRHAGPDGKPCPGNIEEGEILTTPGK